MTGLVLFEMFSFDPQAQVHFTGKIFTGEIFRNEKGIKMLLGI